MFKRRINQFLLITALVCFSLGGGSVFAKVSADKAAHLGQELTPFGAEKAANADGTIPEWTGGLTTIPKGIDFKPGLNHPNPFPDDKPLFKITAQNLDKYKDKVNPGLQEMIKRYPDSFYLKVYKSRRTAAYPDWYLERTKRNATLMELTEDRLGLINHEVTGGVPFPIPTCAEEIMFNHELTWQGPGIEGDYQRGNIFPNGKLTRNGGGYAWMKNPWGIKDLDGKTWDGIYFELITLQNYPPRRKGELLLVKDPLNQSKHPRMAWQYLPGQRRVRRAPTVSYDTPNPGSSGLETYDDAFMFNGGLDRFDWKIIGKKELYIPYNCYDADLVPEKELMTGKHVNPDHVRFELHRVWIIEATLKKGKRHVYGRRMFYVDEDSWSVVTQDMYDRRGVLWRTRYALMKNRYNLPAVVKNLEAFYDFTRPDYAVTKILNELEHPLRYDAVVPDKNFTPEWLRRTGRR
jgi:hypothetical protein